MKHTSGFSFIDSLVTIGITGILFSVALPRFQAVQDHLRANANIRTIQQTLQLARNTAISYGARITACPLQYNRCVTDWHLGLSVFIDRGEFNVIDGQDILIYATGAFPDSDFIKYNRLAIRFQADGLASGTNGTLTYCPSSKTSPYAKAVIINQAGRIRFSKKKSIICP